MNSKKIGNTYEREIAKKISNWITGSNEELICWRTSGSGSVATIRKKKGLKGNNLSGDFQCLNLKYKKFFDLFFIDSKSLTKINLMMTNKKNKKSNKLLNEWKEVVDNAISLNKIPIMLVKVRDDKKIVDFIIVNNKMLLDDTESIVFIFNENEKKYDCTLLTQEDFFNKNNWKELLDNNKV